MADPKNIQEDEALRAQGGVSGKWAAQKLIDQYRAMVPEDKTLDPQAGLENAYREEGVLGTIRSLAARHPDLLGSARTWLQKHMPDYFANKLYDADPAQRDMKVLDNSVMSLAANKAKSEQGRPSDYDMRMMMQRAPNITMNSNLFGDIAKQYAAENANAITDIKYGQQARGVPREGVLLKRRNTDLWNTENRSKGAGRIDLESATPPDLTPRQKYEGIPAIEALKAQLQDPGFRARFDEHRSMTDPQVLRAAIDSYIQGSGKPGSDASMSLKAPLMKETNDETEEWASWAAEQLKKHRAK